MSNIHVNKPACLAKVVYTASLEFDFILLLSTATILALPILNVDLGSSSLQVPSEPKTPQLAERLVQILMFGGLSSQGMDLPPDAQIVPQI